MPIAANSEFMSQSTLEQVAENEVLAFPASAAQEAFFYLEKLNPSCPAFNVCVRFRLDGLLDADILHLAFNDLAERHESFRTSFIEEDGQLLQVVAPTLEVELPIIDIHHLKGGALDTEIDRLGSLEARTPFDLTQLPLARANLLRVAPDHHILQITLHHAVCDGWSIGVITDDLSEFYNARIEGRPAHLSPLEIQYADFSIWQREFLEGPEIQQHLDYWTEKLANYNELELPTDRPRPRVKSWDGDIVSTILPINLTADLAKISREQGATMFHVFLAAFKVIASRYTGSEDIALGTPVAGRPRKELEGIVGTLINSVILRTDLSGDPSFRSIVDRVRDTATEAIEHQDLPFEKLVKALQPRRDPGRNPLFQINFTHQRDFVRPVSFGKAQLTAIPSRSPGAIFDLHFFMVERADGWRASCDFARDLFDRSTALRLLRHFEVVLEQIAANPDLRLSQIALLDTPERATLHSWSGHTAPYPSRESLAELFLASASRHADRTAIRHARQNISYLDLARAADIVAARLRENQVRVGDFVALCAPSVPEMIAAQLGILLVGATCVPLDPEYPAERLAYMLRDCQAPVVLTTPGLAAQLPESDAKVLLLEPISAQPTGTAFPPIQAAPVVPTATSHVFYTSGSTGIPKGVMIPHRAISRLVRHAGFMDFTEDDSFLQAAPISFDASTLEIWMPLLNGGRIVMMGEAGTSLDGIAEAVQRENVTCLWLTAGLFQSMIEENPKGLLGLKYLLAGGDVLSPAHVRRALDSLPGTTLINGYGPTENTTFTCCHTIRREDLERPSIPIGKPIANTFIRILDAHFQPVPQGIPGELFVGGDGLANGYLHQPGLTADKFIVSPAGEILYRTGDRCRWLDDGVVEFLGRGDDQVKIRGFRIETGEIESALLTHPAITQAKVLARGPDAASKSLHAWITTTGEDLPDSATLRDYLKRRLPPYMIPVSITPIEQFSLTPNGKIDLKALPKPGTSHHHADSPPTTPTEIKLAALWAELLERDEISAEDDWFELGGHSLLALRLFSRLHRDFDRSLPLATLISHPTVRSLAAVLDVADHEGHEDSAALVVTLAEGSLAPIFAIHGGDGATLFYRELANRLPDRPFHALESRELNHSGDFQVQSIEDTATAYLRALRATQPNGPYRLAGYSFGGLVAWEMACQLAAAGDEVQFLALIDTANPMVDGVPHSPIGRLRTFWNQRRDLPILTRMGRLAARFIEGTRTHIRVKQEITAAASEGPAEAHTDLRRIQLREHHCERMRVYQPTAFPGTAHLFKARYPGDKFKIPDDYGWASLTGGSLEIREIPGEHLTLFDAEHIEEFASAFEQALLHCEPHR
jgi:amino acid adenylation domain-containing protein